METPGRTNKLPALLGGILLAIGVICAIISATSVSSFEKPTDVKTGKTYYLLGDKSSINSKQCVLRGEGDKPVDPQTVTGFENKISEDGKVKDISLPLTSSKGVVASMEFSKDVSGLKYTCEQGKAYISTKSSGTLNVLRWLTMFGVLAGLLLLVSGLIPRKEDEGATETERGEMTEDEFGGETATEVTPEDDNPFKSSGKHRRVEHGEQTF